MTNKPQRSMTHALSAADEQVNRLTNIQGEKEQHEWEPQELPLCIPLPFHQPRAPSYRTSSRHSSLRQPKVLACEEKSLHHSFVPQETTQTKTPSRTQRTDISPTRTLPILQSLQRQQTPPLIASHRPAQESLRKSIPIDPTPLQDFPRRRSSSSLRPRDSDSPQLQKHPDSCSFSRTSVLSIDSDSCSPGSRSAFAACPDRRPHCSPIA